ncbi:MAG: hypothetical protein BYD32DRAFT_425557 [Podila humilis]|nr:MAG: hypothetical protein BYD32DRAFT_425557 [Podila humilis]
MAFAPFTGVPLSFFSIAPQLRSPFFHFPSHPSQLSIMNYLHFDASDTYFLVQWFPMQTPFSLGVGLVFTSLVCISERLVTFRLEKASMRLHMLQNPTWSRPVRSRNNSASGPPTLAVRPDRSSAIRALAEKSCCYALANTFRLGYMLLAMSFHTGIICVIIASLTLTQFFLDFSTQV